MTTALVATTVGYSLAWVFDALHPVAVVGVVALLGIEAILRDAGAVRLRLPEAQRQIPREVFSPRITLGMIRFGFELGTGARTYLIASGPYLIFALLVLVGSDAWRIMPFAGLGFGLGRAIAPLVHSLERAPGSWTALMQRNGKSLVVASTTGVAGLSLLAAVALGLD